MTATARQLSAHITTGSVWTKVGVLTGLGEYGSTSDYTVPGGARATGRGYSIQNLYAGPVLVNVAISLTDTISEYSYHTYGEVIAASGRLVVDELYVIPSGMSVFVMAIDPYGGSTDVVFQSAILEVIA